MGQGRGSACGGAGGRGAGAGILAAQLLHSSIQPPLQLLLPALQLQTALHQQQQHQPLVLLLLLLLPQ